MYPYKPNESPYQYARQYLNVLLDKELAKIHKRQNHGQNDNVHVVYQLRDTDRSSVTVFCEINEDDYTSDMWINKIEFLIGFDYKYVDPFPVLQKTATYAQKLFEQGAPSGYESYVNLANYDFTPVGRFTATLELPSPPEELPSNIAQANKILSAYFSEVSPPIVSAYKLTQDIVFKSDKFLAPLVKGSSKLVHGNFTRSVYRRYIKG